VRHPTFCGFSQGYLSNGIASGTDAVEIAWSLHYSEKIFCRNVNSDDDSNKKEIVYFTRAFIFSLFVLRVVIGRARIAKIVLIRVGVMEISKRTRIWEVRIINNSWNAARCGGLAVFATGPLDIDWKQIFILFINEFIDTIRLETNILWCSIQSWGRFR
jgi:hypothetical protein